MGAGDVLKIEADVTGRPPSNDEHFRCQGNRIAAANRNQFAQDALTHVEMPPRH